MNTLKYQQPAKFWEEALPLGNGRIGAMVFGGPEIEQIQLNEDTIWSGRPSTEEGYAIKENIEQVRQLLREKKYSEADKLTDQMTGAHDSQCYQMAGNLFLEFDGDGETTNYERKLDLKSAVASTTFERNGVTFSRESFVSAPHQVMAIRLTASQPGAISFRLCMTSKMRSYCSGISQSLTLFGETPASNKGRRGQADNGITWEQDGNGGIRYVAKSEVLNTGGTVRIEEDGIRVQNADEVILLTAITTGFKSWDAPPSRDIAAIEADCDRAIKDAASHDWAELKESHCKDFSAIYDRMSLDLGATDDRPTDAALKGAGDPASNTALTNLVFNFGRYLLISCSRAGTQPANLQGIWNEKLVAPWRSNYTTNINTEMNYWPAETCNMADCAEPLLTFVRELSVSGRRPARDLYGARGWCLHHNSDLWRYCYTGGSKAQHAFWPMCGAWLSQHLWEHYAFSGSRAFLAEALPLMKDAAAFFLDFMVENSDGELVTSPSTSPENRFIDPNSGEESSVCEGSAMDMTMIRELFENIIEGSDILGESDDLIDEIKAAYSKLAMPKIGEDGCLLEFSIEAEQPQPAHRHISHLYGVYPGWMFTPEHLPEYFEACRKSLDARGDKSTGWAMGWRVAMWARLLDGNRALSVIGNLLTYKDADPDGEKKPGGGLYANLFDAHPPFQIDGNFGVTAGIAEMLVQSHQVINGKRVISLLPALPEAWKSGSVSGLRARGAMEVAMRWNDGQVTELSITALQDINCEIRYNGATQDITIKGGDKHEL